MATGNLNDWLKSQMFGGPGTIFPEQFEGGGSTSPFIGRTVESLTPQEKYDLIKKGAPGNTQNLPNDDQIQKMLNTGTYEYTDRSHVGNGFGDVLLGGLMAGTLGLGLGGLGGLGGVTGESLVGPAEFAANAGVGAPGTLSTAISGSIPNFSSIFSNLTDVGSLNAGPGAYPMADTPSWWTDASGSWNDFLPNGTNISPENLIQQMTAENPSWANDLGNAMGTNAGNVATQNAVLSGQSGFLQALMNDPTTTLQSLSQLPAETLKSLGINGASGLQSLARMVLTGDTSQAGQFPFGRVLGGLLEAYGSKQYQNNLLGVMNKAVDYSDPFHNQRPQYQSQFRDLTSNPSNFFKDPAISSTINFAGDAAARKLSSQGFNMSGNYGLGVNSAMQREAFDRYMPYTDMIGTAAGYKFGPGSAGNVASTLGTAAAGAGKDTLAGLGAATNAAMGGSQPSYLDQIFGGVASKASGSIWDYLTQQGAA